MNGYKSGSGGGGIYCTRPGDNSTNSNPLIRNCIIMNCRGDGSPASGGGVLVELAEPTLENCVITRNIAAHDGGGIMLNQSDTRHYTVHLRNCAITENVCL